MEADFMLFQSAMQSAARAVEAWWKHGGVVLEEEREDVKAPQDNGAQGNGAPLDDTAAWVQCARMRVIVAEEAPRGGCCCCCCAVCAAVIRADEDALACAACAATVMHAGCWTCPHTCSACGVMCTQ